LWRNVLIGRSDEIAQCSRLLEQVREGMSGAVVLRGEAGIGKTALLNATAEAAGDLSVMRLGGVESEMQLGYAALHRLLVPYLPRLANLPEPQRRALESAFGLSSMAPADQFMVGLASLSVLGDAARDDPLLILVDDAQWLDHESVSALVFVARRLHADPMAFVFAARETMETNAVFEGIPELRLAGLPEDSARRLLASSVAVPVNHQVAGRIVAITRGNPLALLELSGELSSDHLMDRAPLPDPLPIGQLIEARFLRQVRLLPAETQMILLVAAANPDADPDTLWRAAEVLGIPGSAVEPAETDGLLALNPRVEFRHPLVRSAVYGGASEDDRRRVHQALADVTDAERDPDRRALHMASAASGPDEALAFALEQSAAAARARGGYAAESAFLVRSASLTPDPQQEASRILLAAQAAFLAGNHHHSESMLRQARTHLVAPIDRAQAQRLDGQLRFPLGQPHLGSAPLLEAARAFEDIDRSLSHHALLDAFVAYAVSGSFTEGTTPIEMAQAALASLRAQSTPPTAADTLLRGVAQRYTSDFSEAVPAMRDALRAHAVMSFEEMNRWTLLAGVIAIELWDESELRNTMGRLEHAARAQGALSGLRTGLTGLATIETRAGRFEAARGKYSELQDVAKAIGLYSEFYAIQDVDLLAWQGDAGVRAKVAELTEGAIAFRTATLHHFAQLAVSVLDIAQGRYADALAVAESITETDSVGWGSQGLPIVVEAAIRCGNRDAADRALAPLAERATASATPWGLGLLARCRAMMADTSTAEELYRESVDHLAKTSWLTEIAWTHLAYGEWLRRQKRRTEARERLRQAFDMFDEMGAKAFAERARVELLATGEQARPRRVEAASGLTSRELQVAQLAAQRATSREIAGQLFISANTVDYHLRKVFQKLGVSSRRDLAELLPEGESLRV
jgi:DNA-binding CsgD family transcriptional regulator